VRSGNFGGWVHSWACCCMYWLRLSSRRRGWRPRGRPATGTRSPRFRYPLLPANLQRTQFSAGTGGSADDRSLPVDQAPRYLIRDLDSSYGAVVTHRIQAMGIRDRATAPRSPWQNGHIERLIGSIRRECLDHRVRKCLAPTSAPQSAEEGWARCRSSHLTDAQSPSPLKTAMPSFPGFISDCSEGPSCNGSAMTGLIMQPSNDRSREAAVRCWDATIES
jgi:Integrase core domain